MATATAQVWQDLRTKRPGQDGYRPDLDANFSGDFIEYASPERSGIEGGFYNTDRGLPWHVRLSRALGTPELMTGVDHLLQGDEAYAAAGGFEVEKVPITVAGTETLIPDHWATIRKDTGLPLGVVGRAFKVHPERELIALCDNIVDDGQGKYETGGHMRGGAWFFVSMEMNHLDILVPGDPSAIKTYLLARTAHDGSRKTGFFITQVRTVCKNTENLAVAGAISQFEISHRGSTDGKIAEARRALRIAFKNHDVVKDLTEKMATTSVVDAQVLAILTAAFPPASVKDGDAEAEVKNRNLDRVLQMYEESPNLEGIRGTAWGAYNAVTEFVDFGITYRGRTSEASDIRVASLLEGTGAATKKRALVAALKG